MIINRFNIRVYGLLINEEKRVLLCDEKIKGNLFTKFPGGGLEFGEGIVDCIVREFSEETKLEIKVIKHFYTTEYFQESAFNKNDQIISIYFLVNVIDKEELFNFSKYIESDENKDSDESFKWVDVKNLSKASVTLPIDKTVVGLLDNYFNI